MQITFFLHGVSVRIDDKRKLKQFLAGLFQSEGKELKELTYVFCSDAYLLNINQQFLNHDDFTDIITFTLSQPNEPIIGEIYISAERIMENAQKFEVAIKRELQRVMFHGALHLCGYKDKTGKDKAAMTEKEDQYLQLYIS